MVGRGLVGSVHDSQGDTTSEKKQVQVGKSTQGPTQQTSACPEYWPPAYLVHVVEVANLRPQHGVPLLQDASWHGRLRSWPCLVL